MLITNIFRFLTTSIFFDELAQAERKKRLFATGVPLFALFGMVLCIACYVFYDFNSKAIFPADVSQDAMNALVAAKLIATEGWWWTSSHLSWPVGIDFVGFPFDGNLYMVLLKGISFFTVNPFAMVAYSLTVTVLIGAGLAYFFLRLIGAGRFPALIFAIIFTFSPCLYYRQWYHMHSLPYLVPIGCGVAVLIFTGAAGRLTRMKKAMLYGLCFLLGFGYAYSVVFSLFFIVLATSRQFFTRDAGRSTRVFACISIVLVLVGFILNIIPSKIVYKNDPSIATKLFSFKYPSEADTFGLYIRTLFRPVAAGRFGYREVENIYGTANFELDRGESTTARLGTVGSLGLLFLLWTLFFVPCQSGVANKNHEKDIYFSLSLLTIGAILLAVPGGFGSMINMLSPQIRCYNRLSPYIGFFSITALALFCGTLHHTRFFKSVSMRLLLLITGLTLAVFAATLDQRPSGSPSCLVDEKNVASARAMLQEFKPFLPKQAKILVLPVMTYPCTPDEGSLKGQLDALPFLLDREYFWSVMPLSPSAENKLRGIIAHRGKFLEHLATAAGYDAILYDTRADTPRYVAIAESLERAGVRNFRSRDGVYRLFLVGPGPLPTSFPGNVFNPADPILVAHSGWYDGEDWGAWADKSESDFTMRLEPREYTLTLRLIPYLGRLSSRTMHILVNGREVQTVRITSPEDITLHLMKSATVEKSVHITLRTDEPLQSPKSCGESDDPRRLGIGLATVQLEPVDRLRK